MLQMNHRANTYPNPLFKQSLTAAPLTRHPVQVKTTSDENSRPQPGDSGSLSLEAFLELYESKRSALAYRAILGEVLSKREQAELDILNQWLSCLMEKPEPEDPLVTQAVNEAKRLLNKY